MDYFKNGCYEMKWIEVKFLLTQDRDLSKSFL